MPNMHNGLNQNYAWLVTLPPSFCYLASGIEQYENKNLQKR